MSLWFIPHEVWKDVCSHPKLSLDSPCTASPYSLLSFPSSLWPPLPKRTTFNTLEMTDIIPSQIDFSTEHYQNVAPYQFKRPEDLSSFLYINSVHEGASFSLYLGLSHSQIKGYSKLSLLSLGMNIVFSWVNKKAFCFHLHTNIVNYHCPQP